MVRNPVNTSDDDGKYDSAFGLAIPETKMSRSKDSTYIEYVQL